jgi:hypothetical protein
MRRSHNEQIKSPEVQLNDPVFERIWDELFLVAMTYGHHIRTVYEQMQRPHGAEFDALEWNLFKPILSIGAATGSPEVVNLLVGFANDACRAKAESLNNTAVENVILRWLTGGVG